MKFEPNGLRFTLSTGWKGQREAVGASMGQRVRGDFEITVNFEILQAPPPAVAGVHQTRFTLDAIVGDAPTFQNSTGTLSWKSQAKWGTQFLAWVRHWDADAAKTNERARGIPTTATTGRLRLSRSGSVLSYLVAERPDAKFKLLQKFPFPTDDLTDVRLVASVGSPDASLDVRFTDLHIQADAVGSRPPEKALADLPASGDSPTAATRGWLGAAGVVGMLVLLALLVGLLARRLLLSRVAGPIFLACPACGKRLKARPGLAGKKVKCPSCGEVAPAL